MKRCLVALLVVLAWPSTATSDVGVRKIEPVVARPGAALRITVSGFLGLHPWPAMPVVMVDEARAPRDGASPALNEVAVRRSPYRFLGRVARWRPMAGSETNAIGVLTVCIPAVPPGRYLLGLFCASCVRGVKGSLIVDRRLVLTLRR